MDKKSNQAILINSNKFSIEIEFLYTPLRNLNFYFHSRSRPHFTFHIIKVVAVGPPFLWVRITEDDFVRRPTSSVVVVPSVPGKYAVVNFFSLFFWELKWDKREHGINESRCGITNISSPLYLSRSRCLEALNSLACLFNVSIKYS